MREAKLDLSKWKANNINNLPDMQVDGKVWLPDLRGNKEIKRIPIIGLRVGGSLGLSNCESLTSLPQGLKIGGALSLWGCESLTSLPEGLEVGGSLSLYDCESLTSLPQDLQVGWDIFYSSSTGFAKIDGWEYNPDIIPTHLMDKLRNL